MRNRTFQHRHFDEVLLCIINAFLNGSLNFLGLSKTIANNSILVSNNDNGCKSECSTTFGNLRYTIDCNKTIFKFDFARFYSFYIYFCHDFRILNHLLWHHLPRI